MFVIYNTLTRKKEEFAPQDKNNVLMYTCGVTVYDDCHIGHIRSLYFFEVVKRVLEYAGFRIKWVRNITDIDDKIIRKARQNYGSGKEYLRVARQYIQNYYRDLKAFGLDCADDEPLATENISSMIEIIEALIRKGFAYVTDTGVYFSVRKFSDYGRLSGQRIDHLREAVRVAPEETKEDILDFALWKKSKGDEPSWKSPWMEGRPGWHIECSSMCYKYLAPTIDIHGGGMDLVFPHHENERAQSEAFTGKSFCRYWLHHGLVFVEGKKMSKSLGNFLTVQDYLEKEEADVLKLLILSSSYRGPLDFSWKNIQHLRHTLVGLKKILYYLMDVPEKRFNNISVLKKVEEEFKDSLCDDFDTPSALTCVYRLQDEILDFIGKRDNFEKEDFIVEAAFLFRKMLQVLGLLKGFSIPEELRRRVSEKVSLRHQYRKRREFKKADQIRELLCKEGIVLEDLRGKTVWYKE